MNMPAGTNFFLEPPLRRPGKAASMGHAHAAPYPGSWTIPKKGAERPLRVSGLASRVGSLPGHLQAEPCGSRKSVNPARFFLFFAYLWHPPPCHCLDPRARTEAGTHTGWHEPAPTSALVFRLQDHCDSAQVWVGARKRSALAAPKLNKGCLTQSTAPPKPPEGLTSGTCHRIAGLAGGGGPADMAVCHTHADSGRKSPTNTGGRGTRTQKPPRPEQYDHWRWNSCIFILQRQITVDPLEAAAGADMRRCGTLARKVVFRITYLSYEDKLTA